MASNNQPSNTEIKKEEVPQPSLSSPILKKATRKKMKERSQVWQHFDKVETEEGSVASCKYCKIKYHCDTKKNGTSTLWTHLNKCLSRSTTKGRCKQLGLGECLSKKNKSDCTKKRRINTNSPPGSELPNLLECTNAAGLEYLDETQHNLSDQVALECDSIELNAATHGHIDVHESTPESMVGTEVNTLLGNDQDGSSSRSFDIKVTYKEDIVRFEWSSTACLKELKEAVAEQLKIEVESFKLKYMDEEEDWVLINSDQHLKKALSFIQNNILKLKVIDL